MIVEVEALIMSSIERPPGAKFSFTFSRGGITYKI
jgi:hypothetical protein